MKLTAILNVYRRPEMLEKQVKALKGQTIKPDYIWIWQNKGPEKVRVQPPKGCVIVRSNFNFLYHGRFALGLLAQQYSDFVLFLDDDIIPGNQWVENCYTEFLNNPGLYVGVGTRVEAKKRDWFGWRQPNEELAEVDYGGHSWFLKTDWLRSFWHEKPASLKNAEDIQLSFALQKHLGINTFVPSHPKENKEMWSNLIGWSVGKTKVASQKNPPTGITRKDWFAERRKIEQICINNGWQVMVDRYIDKDIFSNNDL